MNHAATQSKPSKPTKTDFIAFCGWGWGTGPEAGAAIQQMLRHVSRSDLQRMDTERKKLAVRIFECSEDWIVYDHGSVQAKYVVEVATADLSTKLAIKIKDVMNDLDESIDYKD